MTPRPSGDGTSQAGGGKEAEPAQCRLERDVVHLLLPALQARRHGSLRKTPPDNQVKR